MRMRGLGIWTVVLLLLALSACGFGRSEGQTHFGDGAGADQEDRMGTVIKLYNFKVEMSEQLDALVKQYAVETGVNIEVETCGGGCDYGAGLKTKFNSGDRPDIFFVAGYSDLDLFQEHLEDLTDQPWVDDMLELTKPAITKDGAIYGMPLVIEGWGFVYNKDLFKRAGITKLPVTLTELRDTAIRLKAAGIQPFENGYAERWVVGNHLVNVAFALQPDPIAYVEDVRMGREKLTANPVLRNWTDLIDLTVEFGQPNPLQTDYTSQVTNFAEGKAAMMQQGVWVQGMMDKLNPGMDIGLLPMPINDKREAMDKLQVGVPNYWVISRSSKVKRESKAFLNWLVSSAEGRKFFADVRFIPPFKSIPFSKEQIGPLAADVETYIEQNKILPWMWQRYPGYEANTYQMAVQVQAYIGKRIGREQLFQDLQGTWDDYSSE